MPRAARAAAERPDREALTLTLTLTLTLALTLTLTLTRPDREDFFAFMFLARCKHEMGEDDEVLLRRAEVAWAMHG